MSTQAPTPSAATSRAHAARWGLGLGVALWASEVFAAIQLRPTFRLDAWVIGLLGAYLLFGVLGAWRGVAGVHRALVGLTALATAVFCYGELVLWTHPKRLCAAGAGALLILLVDRALRHRLTLGRRTGLMAIMWVLAATQTGSPRYFVLAVMDRRWTDAGGALLRTALLVVIALIGLGIARRFARRPRQGALLGGCLLGAGAIMLTGFGARRAPASVTARGDVIYLVLDSLRGDMVERMPTLMDWAEQGTLMRDAHSPSISTTHSLPRMLNLPEPDRLALRGRWQTTRDGWAKGMPAQARAHGLRTHLISDYAANSLAGLEVYQWNTVSAQPRRGLLLPNLPWALAAIIRGGDDRLRKVRGAKRPFATGTALGDLDAILRDDAHPGLFVVHLAVPHAPYNQPPYRVDGDPLETTRAQNEQLRLGPTRGELDPALRRRMYLQAVAAADAQVARLRSILTARRPDRAPLVIITADHGESLGDRGAAGHGRSLLAEGHHVPWILIGPGVSAGQQIDTPVSNAQSTASVLRWLAGQDPTPSPAKVLRVWHPRGQVVQQDGWRLIHTTDARQLKRPRAWAHHTPYQLFEVRTDPAELRDRFAEAPPMLKVLQGLIEAQ